MKLIHCADLHLDSKMKTNLTGEQAKERKNEILRTFSRLVEYADKNRATAILIAGDLFDTRNVSATARNMVKAEIVNHPDLIFFYLKGNHDDDSFLSKLDEIPENLYLFDDQWMTYTLNNVAITGMEIGPDSQATMYNSLVLDHNQYNIVMLHGQLTGYSSKGKAETISLDGLRNKNIDYLALGHIHEMQTGKLDGRGMYAYPGCLEGRGFDECGEKGFIELDIDEQTLTATYRFVPLAQRCLFELPVDVTGVANTNEAAKRIEQAISEHPISSKNMVKLVLTGELDVECEINTDYLTELFSDYFYCTKITDQTKLKISYEDYEKDESLKGEFVRLVSASDLSEEEKTEIIRCGILALSGEEI